MDQIGVHVGSATDAKVHLLLILTFSEEIFEENLFVGIFYRIC